MAKLALGEEVKKSQAEINIKKLLLLSFVFFFRNKSFCPKRILHTWYNISFVGTVMKGHHNFNL